MSGILGVFGRNGRLPDDGTLRRMAARMAGRGGDHTDVQRSESGVLVTARHDWERADGFSGAVGVVDDGDVTVAADASLYYRDDLRRALRSAGVDPRGGTPSDLILAAYRAWGAECVHRLEGDWAFIALDRRNNDLFAARDLIGTRPLYYAEVGGSLVVASTIGAVLAHPECPDRLNLTALAESASGLFAASHETVYTKISLLPAGSALEWRGGALRTSRFWEPVHQRSTVPFEEAAEELQRLLCRAVEERLGTDGPTTVWLSGGYDSTALFGAGEKVLADRGRGEHLHAISGSYPPGDPGREDELIEAVVNRWGSPITWVDVREIPIFDRPHERAAARDEPFAHGFEMFNRAAAAGTREAGSRVAFTGMGGDPLFAVSTVYFADLLYRGRWLALARAWRARGMAGTGFRNFFRLAIQPGLPAPAHWAATLLRGGRPLRGYLDRRVAPWIAADFARRHELEARERHFTASRNGRSHNEYETYWYFLYPYAARISALVASMASEGGVEVRTPLLDRRVIELALTRPREERSSGRENKRLLRASMRGLLPESVIGPRKRRTGTSGGYFRQALRKAHAEMMREAFREPRLAELGIVDGDVLRERFRQYVDHGGTGGASVQLYLTLQTEIWLRAHAEGRAMPELDMESGVSMA